MRSAALTDLLLELSPLVRQACGRRHIAVQQAWLAVANPHAAQALKVDPALLPANPAEAVKTLLRAVLQLAKQQGMTSAELQDFFNERADAGDLMFAVDGDDALEQAHAVLLLLAVRRMQAEPTPQFDQRDTA